MKIKEPDGTIINVFLFIGLVMRHISMGFPKTMVVCLHIEQAKYLYNLCGDHPGKLQLWSTGIRRGEVAKLEIHSADIQK